MIICLVCHETHSKHGIERILYSVRCGQLVGSDFTSNGGFKIAFANRQQPTVNTPCNIMSSLTIDSNKATKIYVINTPFVLLTDEYE
uniref:Transposase n=1 Tax=Strongyloides venezuelensis TaxID=75913 RepID=A0A0K0FDQ4_STRVS